LSSLLLLMGILQLQAMTDKRQYRGALQLPPQ
jgi:hypothetical protein